MKVEIGESLVYSWLKHIKKCQIVQLNWKLSSEWSKNDMDDIIENISTKFPSAFKKSTNKQFINQAEIDVLGFDFKSKTIYAVDVAFHENGLNYKDNVENITKKILRSVVVLESLFGGEYKKNVFFISPKVHNTELKKLEQRRDEIHDFISNIKRDIEIKLIFNEDFKNDVLFGTLKVSEKISDTSELFLRSLQLMNLFDLINCHVAKENRSSQNQKKIEKKDEKIGKKVQKFFNELSSQNSLTANEIKNLMDNNYSKETFGVNYPIIKLLEDGADKDTQRSINGYKRYYAKIYHFNKDKYLLCNDWYDRNTYNFEQWCVKISTKERHEI
jgi:hypothetical protein